MTRFNDERSIERAGYFGVNRAYDKVHQEGHYPEVIEGHLLGTGGLGRTEKRVVYFLLQGISSAIQHVHFDCVFNSQLDFHNAVVETS